MAFDDLDLEFEDDEEAAKKKKNEAVQVDGDLEFGSPVSGMTKSHSNLQKPSTPQVASPPPAQPAAPVTKIADARAAQATVKKPVTATTTVAQKTVARTVASTGPKVVGSSALQSDHCEVEGHEVVQMREEMRRIQFEAEVKVAVAEYKVELLTELLSDTKLMQHQIEQLLVRINAKHPDMKQEVLMIKKILADFTAKKRK